MVSRSVDDLIPEVRERYFLVKEKCLKKGFDILLYCTLRTLEEQAILWRQTRTKNEINKRIADLNKRGFDFLANVIIKVGPQQGPLGKHITNAYPGASWHNYSEAFDCVPLLNGKAIWDTKNTCWQIYGDAVVSSGLNWAGNWKTFKEFPHAQLSPYGNPLNIHKPKEIYDMLKMRNLL